MNNGMTDKKLRILKYKLDIVNYELNERHISIAVALSLTQILVRDIRIFNGKEKAYLQG